MNARARDVVPPIGSVDSISRWPRGLPWPQLASFQINWDQPTDEVGTLAGPTRFRYARANASPSYEFEIWLTADEAEQFEAWFNEVVELGGEVYLPWVGEGRILYLTEYQLTAFADGWKLHALAVQLYVDPGYCERHVCDGIQAWHVPVIVDADAQYPQIIAELPSNYLRPRLIDQYWSWGEVARLTADYDSADRVIADLGAPDIWNGSTFATSGWVVPVTDTVTASLAATDKWIDVPENWQWEAELADWYARNRMVYIDDWMTLWLDTGTCRLLKDTLPPPWPIVNGSDPAVWEGLRVISNNFPLETYLAC